MNKKLSFILAALAVVASVLAPFQSNALIINPTGGSGAVTSSTIASAGGVIAANNAADFSSTSTVDTNLGLGTTSVPTFNGVVVGATGFQSATTSTINYSANFDTYLYAASSSSGDYGAYLNGLCASSLVNASGSTIWLPQASTTFSTPIVENGRCMFIGAGGGGTKLHWSGAAGTAMVTFQFPSSPWNQSGGGFEGVYLYNNGSATTTNPIVGILMSGGPSNLVGGAHSFIEGNYFYGFGQAIVLASGTYNPQIEFNTFEQNGQSIYAAPASNSGESDIINYNWVADQANGTTANCIQFADNAVEIAFLNGNTGDNCQLRAGSNDQVFVNGWETENTNQDGNSPAITEDSSNSNNMVITGVQVHNDQTSTAQTWSSIFNMNGNYSITGVTLSKQSNATSVPQLISNTNSGNDNGQICGQVVNQVNSGNSFASFGSFPWNEIPAATMNIMGCLSMLHNSYPFGWVQSAANQYTLYGESGIIETIGIPPGGSNTAGFEISFGPTTGISTINDPGTLGLGGTVASAGATITGSEAATPATGSTVYVFTGSGAATDTLPLPASTTNRMYIFKNRGTAALSIAAPSPSFLWLSGTNASATIYSNVAGSSTAFYSDGTYWDQLWR